MSKDADEITALHDSYVRRILDRCLLNEKVHRYSVANHLDVLNIYFLLGKCYQEVSC